MIWRERTSRARIRGLAQCRYMSNYSGEDHSYNLQHTNPYGYRHFIVPQNSLTVFLEESRLKLWKLIKKQHFDIKIPVSLIGAVMFGSIYFMNAERKNKPVYELVKDASSQISVGTGIIFAMLSLHRTYHYNKRANASKFIEEWGKDAMAGHKQIVHRITVEEFYDSHRTKFDPDLFNRCHSIPIELKRSANGIQELERAQSQILVRVKKRKEEEESVRAVLNFFEHMGEDVKCNVADSDYLKDYFYSTIVTHYEFFRKYIEYAQYTQSCRIRYCNFVYLAQTWEKEGFLPDLPDICYRPLVITEADIKEVRNCSMLARTSQFLRDPTNRKAQI